LRAAILFFIRSEMSRYVDGLAVATCCFEAAAWHQSVRIQCSCGHFALHDAHGLWWLCRCRGWNDSFYMLRPRFYCTLCLASYRRKVRPKAIEADRDGKPTITLPMPPEDIWKKEVRRWR